MSRFKEIGSTYVNIDKIETFWRDDKNVLTVELDDGQTLRTRDVMHALENSIIGYDYIVQVIPCIKPLYIRYKGENEKKYESPIYYMGLCASGDVRPLEVCGVDIVCFADDMSNFIGIYNETLDEERKKENERRSVGSNSRCSGGDQ